MGMVRATAVAVALFGLYLLFAGTLGTVEVVAGLLGAAAGTALALALHRSAARHFAGAIPLRAVLRPLASLVTDTPVVGRVLVSAALGGSPRGELGRQPFDPGGDDPRSATRRAVSVLGVSLAPRTFVIRGEREDALLLHSLPAEPPSADRAWPA